MAGEPKNEKTALVTGANRGIGLEVAKALAQAGLRVILAGRDAVAVDAAAEKLARHGGVIPLALDVSDPESVRSAAERLEHQRERVDVLVNNAGAFYEGGSLLAGAPEVLRGAFETNFWGAVRTCRAWVPGMIARGYGRVVNVSSGAGALSEGLEGPAGYALSKAALNALTFRLSREVRGDVKVNAVCPGWVRTRMGGRAAPRSVEEGADTIVWLATVGPDGPNGGFFRDRAPIGW